MVARDEGLLVWLEKPAEKGGVLSRGQWGSWVKWWSSVVGAGSSTDWGLAQH